MQKDIAEKTLEAYNDVFADIVNGLLFNGRQVVDENDLEDAEPNSHYKIGDGLHEQRRDVAKFWKNGRIQLCLFGFENQTRTDPLMPLRVINYDGANYRSQIDMDRKPHPVVTLVLYFGEARWGSRNLRSCLEIPDELSDYVSDYRINVFEIAWLDPEKLKLFRSDFRIVADFFVQKRTNRSYTPNQDTIRHVDAILKTMAALTGDRRYEQAQKGYHAGRGKEDVSMCEVLDKYINDGIQIGIKQGYSKGINQGIKQGISQGIAQGVRSTAKRFLKMGIVTDQQISLATGLSLEEILELKKELESEDTTL